MNNTVKNSQQESMQYQILNLRKVWIEGALRDRTKEIKRLKNRVQEMEMKHERSEDPLLSNNPSYEIAICNERIAELSHKLLPLRKKIKVIRREMYGAKLSYSRWV